MFILTMNNGIDERCQTLFDTTTGLQYILRRVNASDLMYKEIRLEIKAPETPFSEWGTGGYVYTAGEALCFWESLISVVETSPQQFVNRQNIVDAMTTWLDSCYTFLEEIEQELERHNPTPQEQSTPISTENKEHILDGIEALLAVVNQAITTAETGNLHPLTHDIGSLYDCRKWGIEAMALLSGVKQPALTPQEQSA